MHGLYLISYMIRLESHMAQYKQQESQLPQKVEFYWRNFNITNKSCSVD